MRDINYDLIGSVPAMEAFRDTLPEVIARYEASRPAAKATSIKIENLFKTGGAAAVAEFMKTIVNDPAVTARIADGVVIELCAQHFYGIDQQETIMATIDAIKSAEQELSK
jgi:hypothetical protein